MHNGAVASPAGLDPLSVVDYEWLRGRTDRLARARARTSIASWPIGCAPRKRDGARSSGVAAEASTAQQPLADGFRTTDAELRFSACSQYNARSTHRRSNSLRHTRWRRRTATARSTAPRVRSFSSGSPCGDGCFSECFKDRAAWRFAVVTGLD